MKTDWARLCAGEFKINGTQIEIEFADGRKHRVEVTDAGEVYALKAIVAQRTVVQANPDLPLKIWQRNRSTQLVGFQVDNRSRLMAEAWIPKAGLTAAEFQCYVLAVARESDRLEFMLTGQDAE
jgi:hypothetical protein